MGHLRGFAEKKMSIDIGVRFLCRNMLIEGKDKIIKEIRSEIRKSDFCSISQSPDRGRRIFVAHC